MNEAVVWREGKLQPASEATVSVLDAGVLYGDGLFETMRVVDGRVEWLAEHIDRLLRSATALRLSAPGRAVLMAGCEAAAQAAGFERASLRLTVTRGVVGSLGPRGAAQATTASWWVMVSPVAPASSVPVKAVLLDPAFAPPRPEHKSLSWQHAIVAQIEAGDDEGIYTNAAGEITEAISANVFAVIDDELRTPPVELGLPGVTRGGVLAAAREIGIEPSEVSISVADLRRASEVMLSGAVGRLRPVLTLDGETVGDGVPGPVYARLLAALPSA
ncbi:MAG TPA: aminotransferase class IV [Baekduia sp.]|nr:aminotransferase class IV [Baekduia sp.]